MLEYKFGPDSYTLFVTTFKEVLMMSPGYFFIGFVTVMMLQICISNAARTQRQVTECGISSSPTVRVVGGMESPVNAWPWMAAIFIGPRVDKSTRDISCGGVAISELYILSAAHCATKTDTNILRSLSEFTIRLGDVNINADTEGAHPMEYGVDKVVISDLYDVTTAAGDIALFRLDSPATFSVSIQPICLPTPEMAKEKFESKQPFVAGWGRVDFKESPSSRLRHVQLNVINTDECSMKFLPLGVDVSERKLCAGFLMGGKDACQGDSGGPLMYIQNNHWYVIGVTSLGWKCGEPGYPGIYTMVAAYMDWINSNME